MKKYKKKEDNKQIEFQKKDKNIVHRMVIDVLAI